MAIHRPHERPPLLVLEPLLAFLDANDLGEGEPTISAMRARLAAGGYRFDTLIESIITCPQFLNQQLVVSLALETSRRYHTHRNPTLPRDLEARRIRPIADDDCDLGVKFSPRDVIRNRFEV